MRYRSRVNRTIIFAIISLFVCNFAVRLIYGSYRRSLERKNDKILDEKIAQISYEQGGMDYNISLLESLLKLKNLTDSQYGRIYLLIANFHYIAGDMKSYFDVIGKALFYNQRAGSKDDTIYLYANMAKYFLEINADEQAFSLIKRAAAFGSFYSCENILTRIQALQVYSSYLIAEKKYENAYLAAQKIIDDAPATASFTPVFPKRFERSGKAIKAMILLKQNKINEAYITACQLWEKYADENENVSQFCAFDFYMPLLEIKTHWAVSQKKYDKALEFNELYGKYCDMFFFKTKKTQLSGFLMASLPPQMGKERGQLYAQLSETSQSLVKTLINDYTYLADNKFSTVINELELQSEIHEKSQELIHALLINLFIAAVILLFVYAVFREARTDGLTKLFNRRALNSKIHWLEKFQRGYSAIMIDLDDFKKLNDTYGHDFGDEVLRSVCRVVLDSEHHNVYAYRYGGEEIVIILEHTSFDDIIRQAESIRTKICRIKFENGARITASFGIGTKPENPIKQADENLYYAKSKGKNIVAYKLNGNQYLAERRLEIRNPMPDTVKK